MQISKMRIHRRPFIGLLIAMLGVFCVRGAAGAVYYVDDDAALGGDGRSWETAYKYLQDALYDSALAYGDTIRAAAGTYTPDKDEGGIIDPNDRTATFQLVNGVELYGGYAGVPGANPDERNLDTYVSVLSGDLADNFENSYHVVTGSATDPNTILDGFTITAGRANGGYPYNLGGGMYNRTGSPTVNNCIFQGNQAYWGSGIYNHSNSSATFTYCVIINNTAFLGGAIYNENNSSLTVSHCTIADNLNSGMYNVYSHTAVIHCTFTGNSGTAMYNYFSNSSMENCIFSNNSAVNGGGMYNYNGSPIVTNCTFSRNTASQYGGGIYNRGDSSPVLTNVILWGNTAPTGAEIYNYDQTSVPTVSFSDVQGGWEGTSNLDSDPLFADPNEGDWRLKSEAGRWDPLPQSWVQDTVTSPCIDAGNPASNWAKEVCPNGGRINIGAYGGTAQASHSMPDFNYDAIINLIDYSCLANKWLTENDIQNVDLDCNGIVDMIDLKILLDNYLWGL